jgi:Uma2 family endonuclease
MVVPSPTLTNGLPLIDMPPVPIRRMTVDEYHKLLESGVLKSGDPFEFIEGWVVPKMSRNPPHDLCLSLLLRFFTRHLPDSWFCRFQSAVTLPDSEPEPDLAIVVGPERRYPDHHPRPEEIAFVIEVSDSSLENDRTIKARIYARAGIREYWIFNLVDEIVEVYSHPGGTLNEPIYQQRRDYRSGDAIPLLLQGQNVGSINVVDMLP